MSDDPILVFGGSGSRLLTGKICAYLGVPAARGETRRFSEGNLFVRVLENVRGRRAYVVQTIAFSANDHFMELLFWIDALKRASAESVTAVIPYFSYAKGDKKDEPRVSIRARVCADALQSAGVDRVVTLDLHAAQIQGFFKAPVDDLQALRTVCEAVEAQRPGNLVVVAPDAGFTKKARRYAARLRADFALADKQRSGHDEKAECLEVIGDVQGKHALIVDDFTISGGTLVEVSKKLIERGASGVWAAVTHGVFSAGAMARIEASPLAKVLMTDSVETQPEPLSAKVQVVGAAPLLGEAIRRIHQRESLSDLYD
ncbi:MAG: ribose-phosphate diphosphokinase [Planctomycetota bacterium]|nr:ribose-phosphate diphosphokinase [Planctomycetota bacterium]